MAAPRFDREELANAASHALGCALALAAAPQLVEAAAARGGGAGAAAVTAFCASMVLMYAASAACHACPPGRLKQVLQAVDHAAIFVFIAGSVTPYTLVPTSGTLGATIGALIWLFALAGACLKLRGRLRTGRRVSTGLYVMLASLALIAAWPSLHELQTGTMAWLGAGVAAYVVGTGFFLADAVLPFGHLVWHVFALAGSACHAVAVLHGVQGVPA
jgi:hemolysin III